MKTITLSQLMACMIWVIAFSYSQAQGINSDTLFWENRASMHQVRAYFPGLVANGKIYAFGGITGTNGSVFTLTDQIEEYDVDVDSWTVKGVLPHPMYGMATAQLNGAIYIIGGSTDPTGITASNKVYRYFPETGLFDMDTIAPLPEPRAFMSASPLQRVIYATGGADGFLGAVKKDVYAYDPSSNSWITLPPLPNGVAVHTSIAFWETIFLIGGTTDWTNMTNEVLAFDFLTGLWWPQTNPLNHERSGHGSAVLDNAIYTFGGIANLTTNELTVEQAPGILTGDPWEVVGELPYNRRAFGYASAVTAGGDWYIYIFGGVSGSSPLISTQRFGLTLVGVEEVISKDMSTSKNSVVAMPNPFDGTTTLTYELTKSAQVILSVYTMNGKLVAQPVNGHQLPGEYKIRFDGTSLEPGLYYCILNSGQGESGITKMVVMR